MPSAMPVIDQQACSEWTENDRNLYNSLPFYFAKIQGDRRKTWSTWGKLFGKRKWKKNQGDTMKMIRKEPSPHIRQQAHPRPMSSIPRKDVMNVREVTQDVVIRRHRFESPVLNFYPSFNDFLDHVEDHAVDIMEKIERYEDVFCRTSVLHMAPFMFISNGKSMTRVNAPAWSGTGTFDEDNDGKTPAVLAALINAHNPQPLQVQGLMDGLSQMETDLRIPAFSGSELPTEDAPLADRFLLITGSETYNSFSFDPWVLANKNCNFDIVNNQYKGSIMGRITSRLEDLPLHLRADGSMKAPEMIVGSSEQHNLNETIPNPEYASLGEDGSPYAISFLLGKVGYDSLEVGPPPSAFAKDEMPHNFPGMFWNGEVKFTKRFLVPCVNEDTGEVTWEANAYGEHIKAISQISCGVAPRQRRSIIPILHLRKRGE